MSSTKLREFIRQVRACKSAAEERAVVAKECAKIRTNFKNEGSHRQRDVAKVLFIALLGHPTQFAQVECLKLVASNKFGEKRVGYLGLTLLLDETSEVSLLATNSFKRDLQHSNQYINGLALSALANAASTDACKELLGEVETLLGCSNPFIRKKAAAAAARCCRRVPDAASRFQESLEVLFSDRCHGVLLGACSLLHAVLDAKPDAREVLKQSLLPHIVKALKSCCATASSVAGAQSGEYDIAGVSDPLLQARLLRAVARLCQGEPPGSPALAEALAFVATNTDPTKNAGCCVLYECVVALLKMKADEGLRVLGTNILGRFLSSRDQNFRYIALGTLKHLVATDSKAVAKYRDTILDCLKGSDASICRRALDVLVCVMEPSNAPLLVRELLSFLLVCEAEHKRVVAEKLAAAVLKHAPTQRWKFDNALKLLCVAGIASLVGFVQEAIFRKACLGRYLKTALDIVGEFGELLVSSDKTALLDAQQQSSDTAATLALTLTERDVAACIERFASALRKGVALTPPPRKTDSGSATALLDADISAGKSLVSQALVTCAAKLASKLPSQRETFLKILQDFSSSREIELQQRSTEFLALLTDPEWKDESVALFRRMPPPPRRREVFPPSSTASETSATSCLLLPQDRLEEERPVGPVCFDVGDIPLDANSAVADETLLNGELSQTASANSPGNLLPEGSLTLLDTASNESALSRSLQVVSQSVPKASSLSPATISTGGDLEVLADLFSSSGLSNAAPTPTPVLPDLKGPVSTIVSASATPNFPSLSSGCDAAVASLSPPVSLSPSVSVSPSVSGFSPTPTAPYCLSSPSVPSVLSPIAEASLNATSANAPSASSAGVCVVTALDEAEGIRVELECFPCKGGGCDVEARVSCRGGNAPLQQLRLEAAVPKYLTLEMLPPSGDVLFPGSNIITQRMRVLPAASATDGGEGGGKLLMKCRLSFSRNSTLEQRLMRIDAFPPDLLKGR